MSERPNGWDAVIAVTDGATRREADLWATIARVSALADEIERGEWGDHWRDLNVHGAIRERLQPRRTCPECGGPVEGTVQHYARIGEWFDPMRDGMQGGETVPGAMVVSPCGCRIAPGVMYYGDAETVAVMQPPMSPGE